MPAVAATDPEPCLAAITEKLDPRAAEVLHQITGTGRQLLAAQSYLRNANRIADNWSWSQQQIDAYRGSAAQQQLDADIDRVRWEFEVQNPGFTLFVNPQVRSLEVQIERWNANASVATAAAELQSAAAKFVATSAISKAGTAVSPDSCANFLLAYVLSVAPTMAAPGLSAHGQMRAVDFHIMQGATTVAGPDTSTIERDWVRTGWRDKLAAAVIASGAKFEGPLERPDEPWHYTWRGTGGDCAILTEVNKWSLAKKTKRDWRTA